MKKILSLFILFSLTSCTGSDVKSTLGLKKKAPDEFMVLSRPALTVPPAFDLPEPESAATGTPKDFSSNGAKSVLFGASSANKASKSKAENLFLNKAGFENAHSDIREKLDEDIRATEEPTPEEGNEKGFFSRLFEPIKLDDDQDPIINPASEKERIKDAKASGEKINGADAETIQTMGESTLDRIFGR